MKKIDLVTFKTFFELEEQGYVKLFDLYKYDVLVKKGYLIIKTETETETDEKYEITHTGKPYLKFYGKVIWVKPHAIKFIHDVDEVKFMGNKLRL